MNPTEFQDFNRLLQHYLTEGYLFEHAEHKAAFECYKKYHYMDFLRQYGPLAKHQKDQDEQNPTDQPNS